MFYGGVRPVVPKVRGIQTTYHMWRKNNLSYLFEMDCKTTIEQPPISSRIGSEQAAMSALREQYADVEIESAKRAWTALCEAVTASPLNSKMYSGGSPSEAWSTIEEWYTPRGVSWTKSRRLNRKT